MPEGLNETYWNEPAVMDSESENAVYATVTDSPDPEKSGVQSTPEVKISPEAKSKTPEVKSTLYGGAIPHLILSALRSGRRRQTETTSNGKDSRSQRSHSTSREWSDSESESGVYATTDFPDLPPIYKPGRDN
eukprot:sb/3474915/